VPIVDAGFQLSDNKFYNLGKENDAFIKSYQFHDKQDGYAVGKVWPGRSVYLDYFNPKASVMWNQGLEELYSNTLFDGIWIDMNEVTQLCGNKTTGECPWVLPLPIPKEGPGEDEPEPYAPTRPARPEFYELQFNPVPPDHAESSPLTIQGISLDAYHYDEKMEEEVDKWKTNRVEFNTHSVYGAMQMKATWEFWQQSNSVNKKRPFILSRSTFPGAGQFGYHWLGDNWAKWEYLKLSIAGIFDFNMFGIPLVGADICGFFRAKDEKGNAMKFDYELCARWH
jgi:alpha-D-xyloside xylohydrolase